MALEIQIKVGAYAYAAGTDVGTIAVPADARVTEVFIVGDSGGATLTIGDGDTITIPEDVVFERAISGAAKGADVVLDGAVKSYYVAWESGV